jgi:hypothetical protein
LYTIAVASAVLAVAGCYGNFIEEFPTRVPVSEETPPAAKTPTPSDPDPTATATPAPTATPEPTATTPPTWNVPPLVRYPNGFAGCNPGRTFREVSPGVVECEGDMTYWFFMPGYDVVPKCKTCKIDDPYMPCGGAPACDRDHMSCERVFVGCGGRDWDNHAGPDLKITGTGLVSLERMDNPYRFILRAKKGSLLTLTACPPDDFRSKDGIPIPHMGPRSCQSKAVQF